MTEREVLRACVEALKAASHALRSYQYGNSARDLAEDIANRTDAALALVAALPPLGPGAEREVCGQNAITLSLNMAPTRSGGCGDEVSGRSVFRCADCNVPFHRACIRAHFGHHETGGT